MQQQEEKPRSSPPAKAPFPWKKALSMALFAVMIALLGWYVWANRADMAKLLSLSAANVLKLVGLAFLGCVANCVYHKIILDTYGVPMSLTDWMGVVCVSNAISYFVPMRGDLVFTGTYYKRVKGLRYTKSLSMLGGNIVFGVAFALVQMGAALLLTGLNRGSWPPLLWLAWGGLSLALAALIALALAADRRLPKPLARFRLLGDVAQGFGELLRNRRMLLRVVACLTLSNVIKLLSYIVCFGAIGLPITFYEAMFYNGVSWLATIVAVVPGNLGVREGIMGVATGLMGDLVQNGVAVSLLQRAAELIVYMAMGLGFSYPVWKRWGRGDQ